MEKKSLYIVIAIVVVAALVLSFGNLTGRSVGECIDSDGAEDPFTPGSVSFTEAKAVYKDECTTKTEAGIQKYLKERYCIDELANRIYFCEGGCLENANGEGYCGEGEARIFAD